MYYSKMIAFFFLMVHVIAEPSALNKKRSLNDPISYTNQNNQVYNNNNNNIGHPDNTHQIINSIHQGIPFYHRPYPSAPVNSQIGNNKPYLLDMQRPYQLEKPLTVKFYHRPYPSAPVNSQIGNNKPYLLDMQRPYQLEKPLTVKSPVPFPPVRQPVIQRVPYPVPVDRPYPVPVPRHIVVERQVPVYVNQGIPNTAAVYMGEPNYGGFNMIYPNDLQNNNFIYPQLQLQAGQQPMQSYPVLGHSDAASYQHHITTIHH